MKYEVTVQGKKYVVDVREISPKVFEVQVNGKKISGSQKGGESES